MRQELNHIEEIENYLTGKLSQSEKVAFEAKMLTNDLLKNQVAAQKLVQQAALRKAIRADVLTYGAGAAGTSGWSFSGSKLKWFSIFGGGLLLIAIFLGGYFWSNKSSSDKIIANYERSASFLEDNSENSKEPNKKVAGSLENQKEESKEYIKLGVADNSEEKIKSLRSNTKIITEKYTNEEALATKETLIGGLKTWATPEFQYFEIIPKKGATIECKSGTLIIVPENAFVDDNGNDVSSNVTLEVVEALTMAEMVGYNLVTMNDDKALASGGMIYIQPKSNGMNVNINPENPLYIEIPTEEYDPEMMAWESEIDNQGDINWKNPKPLEKYLTKIDFANLDFLPEGFAEAVAAGMPYKHYTEATDELVDSLYYNFGLQDGMFMNGFQVLDTLNYTLSDARYKLYNGKTINKMGFFQKIGESLLPKYTKGKLELSGQIIDKKGVGIPNVEISIKQGTLINNKYIITDSLGYFKCTDLEKGHTFVVTNKKEYKDKRKAIKVSYLIDSLSKPIVLKSNKSKKAPFFANGTFPSNNFNRGDFVINPQAIKAIRCSEFENTFLATVEFEQRIKQLHNLWNAQNAFDLYVNNLDKQLWEVDQMVSDILIGENKLIFEIFSDELKTNVKNNNINQVELSSIYKNRKREFISGLTNSISNQTIRNRTTRPSAFIQRNRYATSWFQSGWMNIDKYLKELGNNPQSVKINCGTNEEKERTKVYQCLNTIKAIIPLVITNKIAEAKFSKNKVQKSRMRKTYCIGLKRSDNNLLFAYRKYNPYKEDEIKLKWKPIHPTDLIAKLKSLPGFNDRLINELEQKELIKKKISEQKENKPSELYKFIRRTSNLDNETLLHNHLKSIIYKHSRDGLQSNIYTIVDIMPEFIGGEKALKEYINENTNYPIECIKDDIESNYLIEFYIDTDGSITLSTNQTHINSVMDSKLKKQYRDKLFQEALRLVSQMPNWKPGIYNDQKVAVGYILPISFCLE